MRRPVLFDTILLFLFGLLFSLSLVLIFFYAPLEKTMGVVQKIFYIHVPSAFIGFVAFLLVFIFSIAYLSTKKGTWDSLAEASAEVGFLFLTLVILTGPLWAKPVWGAWWVWDPRLTTTFILWLINLAYLLLRSFSQNSRMAANYCAVLGIIGFLDIPFIYSSVLLWRGMHPRPVIFTSQGFGSGLDSRMTITLLVSLLSLLLLFLITVRIRWQISRAKEEITLLRLEMKE